GKSAYKQVHETAVGKEPLVITERQIVVNITLHYMGHVEVKNIMCALRSVIRVLGKCRSRSILEGTIVVHIALCARKRIVQVRSEVVPGTGFNLRYEGAKGAYASRGTVKTKLLAGGGQLRKGIDRLICITRKTGVGVGNTGSSSLACVANRVIHVTAKQQR